MDSKGAPHFSGRYEAKPMGVILQSTHMAKIIGQSYTGIDGISSHGSLPLEAADWWAYGQTTEEIHGIFWWNPELWRTLVEDEKKIWSECTGWILDSGASLHMTGT